MNIEKAKLIGGWMPEIELEWLAKQAEIHNNILELGSFLGRSTRALCDNTSGFVTAVDLWKQEGNKLEANYDEVFLGFQDNLKEYINGKLLVFPKSTDNAIEFFQKNVNKFDFIFIDADHTYEQIRKDIIGCKELLTPNGLISGHDFNWEGVEKAVKELFPSYKLHNYIWYIE